MKKLLLLIVILFSVSYSFAQEEQLSEKEKARREKNIQAGNPFARFGYKAKVATLSKGKYLEFHDLDSIVKIGSFSYHVKRKVVTGFTKYDTVYPESTLRPEIVSRWLSPDPLSEEFPSWSPYNFTLNNPIRFVDPDGLAAEDIIIKGTEKNAAFKELQSSVSSQLTLSMDNNGKVTYTKNGTGKLSKDAKQLVSAIDNSNIVVNINSENTTQTKSGALYVGGAFSGNTVTNGKNGNTVVAEQEINPIVLNKASLGNGKPGADTLHEVTEAYQGALISQKSGVSSPAAGSTGSVYSKAHRKATPQSGKIYETLYDSNGKTLNMTSSGAYPKGVKKVEWSVKRKGKTTIIQTLK